VAALVDGMCWVIEVKLIAMARAKQYEYVKWEDSKEGLEIVKA